MSNISNVDIINQRKWQSHALIATLSLIIMAAVSIGSPAKESVSDNLNLFIILLIQIETFIFIASRIFMELPAGLSRKTFTSIILTRFFLFIVICFLAAFIIYISSRMIFMSPYSTNITLIWQHIIDNELINWIKSTLKGLSVGAVIFIFIQWQDALKREQKLREENLIFQNETLKNQINPHFLFNNLNTLSSLVKADPETSEKFIGRLASIYRYILDNSNKDKVKLKDELGFINDYFYLHSIRDEGKMYLNIRISEPEKYDILPVSLQILVENAIKHNMATMEKQLTIEVYDENENIVVRNNLQKKAYTIKQEGIGLKNLSERIRIITGKNILIDENADYFTVKVPLIS